QNRKVLLACSGWKDRVNMEDSLFAGAVVASLQHQFLIGCDSAKIAANLYQQALTFPTLLDFLKDSSHYKRLEGFGLVRDMEYCTTANLHPVVPVYNGKELMAG